MLLAENGEYEAALKQYQEVLRLSPDNLEAQNNTAWILATCPDGKCLNGDRAVRLAERVCAMTKREDASYLDTLAAAYAEAGRFPEAIATARETVALASLQGRLQTAAQVRGRLELYKAQRPYREIREP